MRRAFAAGPSWVVASLVAAVVAACTGPPPDTSGGPADGAPPPLPHPSPSNDATAPDAPAAVDAADSPDTADLDAFILDHMHAAHSPGLAVAILAGDKVRLAKGYGLASIAKNVPVTADTLFQLASISKTVTVTAVLQLVEGKAIDLDADISAAAGFQVNNPHFPAAAIPMRSILTHTSSLVDSSVIDTIVSENVPIGITLEQFAKGYFLPGGTYYDAKANFDAVHPPGTNWNYCNAAIALAGYAVEFTSGTAFDDYCEQHIFEPLGMHESSFRLAGLDQTHIAMEYAADGVTEIGYDDYPDFPDGELRTSVAQLARFLLAYMNGGALDGTRILSEATIAEVATPQVGALNPDQGLVWYYETHTGRRILGHEGILPGVSTIMGYDPMGKIGAIVLSNGSAFQVDADGGDSTWADALVSVFDRLLKEAAK